MGRSTDNSVQIADGQASRLHAEVRYENGRHHIVDLGSTNGTFVNGIQIEKTYTLSHGDIITIGPPNYATNHRDYPRTPISNSETSKARWLAPRQSQDTDKATTSKALTSVTS